MSRRRLETFAEQLLRLRGARSLSQAALALEAGLSQTRVSDLERGALPGLRDFSGLRRVLDLDLTLAVEGALEQWETQAKVGAS